jgi:hypothetical protein
MKSEEYYKLTERIRVKDIKENAEESYEQELVNLMEEVFKEGIDRLIKKIISLNDLEVINKELNEFKHSVTERDLDIIKEFFSLNNESVYKLDYYWVKELKRFGKNVLFYNIELKEGYDNLKTEYVQNKYSLFLKSFQLLNDLK